MKIVMIITALLLMFSCSSEDADLIIADEELTVNMDLDQFPQRTGARPATTDGVPHIQLDQNTISASRNGQESVFCSWHNK